MHDKVLDRAQPTQLGWKDRFVSYASDPADPPELKLRKSIGVAVFVIGLPTWLIYGAILLLIAGAGERFFAHAGFLSPQLQTLLTVSILLGFACYALVPAMIYGQRTKRIEQDKIAERDAHLALTQQALDRQMATSEILKSSRQRRCAADDHQRHPRFLEDRGRANGRGDPPFRPARVRGIGAGPDRGARGRETTGHRLCVRGRRASGHRR